MYNPHLIDAIAADRRRDAEVTPGSRHAGRNGPLIRARQGIGHGLILLGVRLSNQAGVAAH